MASSLAVWGDKLVAHGMGDGRVRVLDRRSGRVLWSRRVGSAIESSPVVRYGIDYFGTRSGHVYALNLRTNRVRWVYRSGAKITASVSLAGRTAYVGNYAGRVVALSTRTGTAALDELRQRARLRHGARRRWAALRSFLDRRIRDGFLDQRETALEVLDRLVRVLVARHLGRPGRVRVLQRHPLRHVA